MSLVALDEETETVHPSASSRMPPDWVNYLDEAQYELTRFELFQKCYVGSRSSYKTAILRFLLNRIRSRLKQIREMQQNLISKPSFVEDLEAQKAMDASTDEVTKMFSHCQRLIRFFSV